ncbi:hypothetical protein BJX64DRAFT_300375 [Aspergillus heterothallicus]
MDVHVVSKTNNNTHAAFRLPTPTTPLAPSSIRVQPSLLGLTSNNLTYALLGDMLHWWDTYPLPPNTPAPYNDRTAWGIVPAWGFATVLSSTIPDLPRGTTIWGYWPASGHIVDLALEHRGADPESHWVEVSPHRKTVLELYNRYIVLESPARDETRAAWESVMRPLWQCGYMMAEYVLTHDPASKPPIHPLPGLPSVKAEWTARDADVRKTVIVSLGASSKTGRSFAHNLALRPGGKGPLGFLQVTSAPGGIQVAVEALGVGFASRAVDYEELKEGKEVAEWIVGLKPERILVFDFGSRDGGWESLNALVKGSEELSGVELLTLNVGYQQKVYTLEDVGAAMASAEEHGKVQLNTSPIISAAFELQGAVKVFAGLEEHWDHWVKNQQAVAPDLKIVWGEGVVGEKGIEGGWTRLTKGGVRPEEALVYRIP